MRYTLIPKLHLSRLPRSTRILLTCFVLSIDVALWFGSLKYTDRAEFSASGAENYWHGDAPPEGAAPPTLLPGEEEIEGERGSRGETPAPSAAPKSSRYLVDTVHPHLFTVPIVLFILLHLLSLTRLPEGAKIAVHLHAFASFAATFGLPFWIASGGHGALLFVLAGANLMLSFVFVSAVLLLETWRPARASGNGSPNGDEDESATADAP